MKIGPYQVSAPILGFFRLDGGSMFGSVPKNLWSRKMDADQENCIRLATRSLLIEGDGKKILVDVGNGDKWDEKRLEIFQIQNTPSSELNFEPTNITDVILTHLHFDHAGGISRYAENRELALCYPNASVYLQKSNYENAQNPNPREVASYLPENVTILESADLHLLDGNIEIFPGVSVVQVNGHTRGQQFIEVTDEQETILFPTDLMPTAAHVPLPYNMGYDICAETILKEKEAFLNEAHERKALVVFEHDPEIAAGRIGKDQRGRFELLDPVPSLS